MKKEELAAALTARVMLCGVFAAIFILSSQSVRELLPFNRFRVIYSVFLELLSIIVLVRLPDSSIRRDMIDMSLWFLLLLEGMLCLYFADYDSFCFAFKYIYNEAGLFVTGLFLFRLIWIRRDANNSWVFRDWPAFGLYGWTHKPAYAAVPPSKDDKIWLGFGVVAVALIAVAIAHQTNGWLQVSIGSALLTSIYLWGNQAATAIVANAKDVASLTETLEDYKVLLVDLANRFGGRPVKKAVGLHLVKPHQQDEDNGS